MTNTTWFPLLSVIYSYQDSYQDRVRIEDTNQREKITRIKPTQINSTDLRERNKGHSMDVYIIPSPKWTETQSLHSSEKLTQSGLETLMQNVKYKTSRRRQKGKFVRFGVL